MPITNGRYASRKTSTPRERLAHHWFWLRHRASVLLARPGRLTPEDNGAGHTVYREWGHWTVRPVAGWRSHRWITPPTHATRRVSGSNHDAACEWAMTVLGI